MRAFFGLAFAVLLAFPLACTEGTGSPHSLDSESVVEPAGSVLNFVAPLEGAQEVPAVETKATGVAKFQLSKDGSELDYKLIVANIEDVTQSHIHCGPTGVNGPITVFLFGFDPAGVTVNGILAQGTITDADVIPLPDSEVCPGGIASLADVIAHMTSGNAYTNVHTILNPGGEIRGQTDRGNGGRGN